MNPIYKFDLTTEYNGVTHDYAVHPLYDANLSKDYQRESNQMFFRAKLNGKLTFVGNDYAIIKNARFETQFTLVVSISWNNGATWAEYWRGEFYKTDCKVDEDARNIVVTPNVTDGYKQVLAGLDKEYDLIDLKPTIDNVILTKRPLIQVYVPGESVISCFLSGMYWEQDCDAVSDINKIQEKYHFSINSDIGIGALSGGTGIDYPKVFYGNAPWTSTMPFSYTNGAFTLRMRQVGFVFVYELLQNDVVLWDATFNYNPPTWPNDITLYPVSGTGAEGEMNLSAYRTRICTRYLLDVDNIMGTDTYPIPDDDMCDNNRNYGRVIDYKFDDVIHLSSLTTNTPTEWGIKQPGEYWVRPSSAFFGEMFPVGRSHWGDLSIWFTFSALDFISEQSGRKEYTLHDVFPLSSVISVLLNKVAPGITHEATPEYSHFLYDANNPISSQDFRLYITPKSNILAGEYQQPAQKAPITLKKITEMLRDCFRAYWYVEDGKFKIEHIKWFMNGGNYTGTPVIAHDLTTEKVTRNGKTWAFATSQYNYEKTQMPERYQFGWMDEVTKAFEGYPIEIRSRFVEPGRVEQIEIMNFTSDIDYMLLNPGECSKDGFALMAARQYNTIPVDVDFRDVSRDGIIYNLSNIKDGETITIDIEKQGSRIMFAPVDANGEKIGTYGPVKDSQTVVIPAGAVGIIFYAPAFVLSAKIKVVRVVGTYYVPFVKTTIGVAEYDNQNGLLAFINLQPWYYLYDMPAYPVTVNEIQRYANSIQRGKKQSISFPVVDDPNPMELIKTYMGNGQFEKISVNLSSRNAKATLQYNTYESYE